MTHFICRQRAWRMELLDECRRPVFRIRLVAETLQDADQES
jgi:hypothetical protein